MPLIGQTTLFAQTLAQCSGSELFGSVTIVTGEPYVSHVEAELTSRSDVQLIVEPFARNTAAAIALAALRLPEDAIMLVCPSDHYVSDVAAFHPAVRKATALAADGWLVSLGIEADRAETGFGYLERGDPIRDIGYRTSRFIEKPDLFRAEQLLASGNCCWNSGIFAFRAGTFLDELETYRPGIAASARAAVEVGRSDGRNFYPGGEELAAIASESVDYAVMENTQKAAMVPADMGWSDIGSWDALQAVLPCDDQGNYVRGDVELVDCQSVLVDSDGPRVSVIGLEGVIVVVDGDDVLITSRAGAQKVGRLKGAAGQ